MDKITAGSVIDSFVMGHRDDVREDVLVAYDRAKDAVMAGGTPTLTDMDIIMGAALAYRHDIPEDVFAALKMFDDYTDTVTILNDEDDMDDDTIGVAVYTDTDGEEPDLMKDAVGWLAQIAKSLDRIANEY